VVGVASRWIVGASASVIFPCIKPSRCRAIMEEVDKGCSEFCVSVGMVTRTAGIQFKKLAVNQSRPFGRLWLYAGLIGSNNPCCTKQTLLCVRILLFLLHRCEWVNVSSGTGSLR